MGGESHFKVPDWKNYKVNGIRELEWVQESLAQRGLKDPWLRNEVWRYNQWPGYGKAATQTLFKGFRVAAVAMILTVAADKVLGLGLGGHGGGHGHDDHH